MFAFNCKSIIKDKPILWVLGPSGAGKKTMCDKLHVRYGYTHLNAAELMRVEILEGSNRSLTLAELMKNGQPVPDSMVVDIIAHAIIALAKESRGGILRSMIT